MLASTQKAAVTHNIPLPCEFILLSSEQQERLKEFFADSIPLMGELDFEYWIENDSDNTEVATWDVEEVVDGDSDSFCRNCAEIVLKRLQEKFPDKECIICDGYGIEGDSVPFCGVCLERLENTLTDYGCESELEYFLAQGFDVDCADDRYSMHHVLFSMSWRGAWDLFHRYEWERDYQCKDRIQRHRDLHRLGRQILLQLDGHWDDLLEDLQQSHTPG